MAIEEDIKSLLRKVIAENETLGKLQEIPDPSLENPKEAKFGDFFTNIAFILAKKTPRISSLEIAQQIQQSIDKKLFSSTLREKIERIEVKGEGFINFFLSPGFLYETVRAINKTKNEH